MIRLANRPSGRGVVRAEPTLEQISFSKLKAVTFLQLVQLFLGRLLRRLGARFFFFFYFLFLRLLLRPFARFFERVVEVLVPGYLPRLALLSRSLPHARFPLDVFDRPDAIEGRGGPRGLGGGAIALFGNGSVAVRKITIKYSGSEVMVVVVVVVVVVVIGTTGARFVVVYNVVLLLDGARRRGNGSGRAVAAAPYLG